MLSLIGQSVCLCLVDQRPGREVLSWLFYMVTIPVVLCNAGKERKSRSIDWIKPYDTELGGVFTRVHRSWIQVCMALIKSGNEESRKRHWDRHCGEFTPNFELAPWIDTWAARSGNWDATIFLLHMGEQPHASMRSRPPSSPLAKCKLSAKNMTWVYSLNY